MALERTLILLASLVPGISCNSVFLISFKHTESPSPESPDILTSRIVYTPRNMKHMLHFPLNKDVFVQCGEKLNIMAHITNNETPLGITRSYEWFKYMAGEQLHTTLPFVFRLCSKHSASAENVMWNSTLDNRIEHFPTREYCWVQFFIAWIFIFKFFPSKQMLLLWQHLITSLTLECLSLNDFRVHCSRKSGARDSFPYLNFIILGKGGIPCFTEEITFEPQCEDFLHDCMKSHNFLHLLRLIYDCHQHQKELNYFLVGISLKIQ